MKALTSFLILVICTIPSLGETVENQYSKKIQALTSLQKTVQRAVNPTDSIVFPWIGNGVLQGIRYVTSIVLTNNTFDPLSVTLNFTGSSGSPLTLILFDSTTGASLGFDSTFTFNIPALETVFLETDGSGTFVDGWAQATALVPESMGGVAAFQLIVDSTEEFLTIVGVGGTDATPAFFIPAFKDSLLTNSNTALALANTSNTTAFLRVFLFGNDGSDASTTISLGPKQTKVLFVDQIFSSIGSRFFGTLHFFRVDSVGEVLVAFDIHPVVLLLSNGILSSIPVTNIISF